MQVLDTVITKNFSLPPAFRMQVLGSSENEISAHCIQFTTLFSHINGATGISLTEAQKENLKQGFKTKKIRRRQYLLQQGDVCRYMYFIVTGALRMYSVNDKGNDSIVSFGLEENWISDQESLNLQSPSLYNIDAVEDTTVLFISLSHMKELAGQIPAVDQMLRQQDHQQAIATQKRIHSVISMTADERFQDLKTYKPQYLQRFNQNMLAAYLGIKPETLSRVRNK